MSTASLDLAAARRRPPALVLSDGAIEVLKWGALVLMTFDHVNKYLLHDASAILFAFGRLVMPIFGIVLGYNLARPGAHAYGRVAVRLAIVGVAATPAFIALGGLGWGWWPLNIMATLLAATLICGLLDAGGPLRVVLAAIVFLITGSSVEFWWPGIGICVSAWSYAKRPSWTALLLGVVSTASLYIVNRNMWAMASLPLTWLAMNVQFKAPRFRSFFYAYYAGHLTVLALVIHYIVKADAAPWKAIL